MIIKNLKDKGQSTMEYTIIVILVVGAILAMSTYFKRALQGRWKIAVDDLGDQYDPRATNSFIQHTIRQNTSTVLNTFNVTNGFFTIRADTANTIETKTGHMTVGGF